MSQYPSFVDKYQQLDEDHLHKEFEQFPSLSILILEYPRNYCESTNPLYSFYQGDLQLLSKPKIAVGLARPREGVHSVEKNEWGTWKWTGHC